ncbi:MAG: response regulator, partial [Planctomycetota bacterium]
MPILPVGHARACPAGGVSVIRCHSLEVLMDQHILIVDDDEMFRRILAHHLRSAGYTVVEATSGHEALEIISSRPSPIVITDRDMPNMGGLELCRALRGCEAFGVLYIMMITATDNEDSLV